MSKSFDIHKPLDLSEGVTRKGSRSWAITESKAACEAMIAGEKTAELRLSVPSALNWGDVVYVIKKGSGGKVVCRFTVAEIIRQKPGPLWEAYKSELAMEWRDYVYYTYKWPMVSLIRFEKVQEPTRSLVFLEELGLLMSPKWFVEVKPPKAF